MVTLFNHSGTFFHSNALDGAMVLVKAVGEEDEEDWKVVACKACRDFLRVPFASK